MSLLKIEDAVVEFRSSKGVMRAVDGVSLNVERGEIVAVVGESGCGKTTLARAVLGLQPLARGRITLDGRSAGEFEEPLAATVGMVWQDPFASLDPRWKIEDSALEPARLTRTKIDADQLFHEVGLSSEHRLRYPHQLSGGQRQRAAIARAIALRPPLVICDEPTAALDLSIRAQILNLLKSIQAEIGCSFLYISHDLNTVRFLSDRIAVMYLGKIVESGPTAEVFAKPRHPYTCALLEASPTLDTLGQIPGAPVGELPDPFDLPRGCRFAPRCPRAQDVCLQTEPDLDTLQHSAACYFPTTKDAMTVLQTSDSLGFTIPPQRNPDGKP